MQTYARLSGFLFLFFIVVYFVGTQLASSFHVAGDFARTAANVQGRETLYRTGLVLQLLGGMTSVALGWSLYVLLRRVHPDLALLALLWRVCESLFFGVLLLQRFTALGLYTGDAHAFSIVQQQDLTQDLLGAGRQAAWEFAGIHFAVGSTIFFALLLRSRMIPRALALLGVVGSVLVIVAGLATLVLPEASRLYWFFWAPIGVTEVIVGSLLLIRGADLRNHQASPAI